MKNVDGWETGTYYGKPLYNDGKWHSPDYIGFYTHNDVDRLVHYHRRFRLAHEGKNPAQKSAEK